MSTFEDAIIQAIANQFFMPQVTGTNSVDGGLYYGASPSANLAQLMFNNNKQKIIEAVAERLDLDKLADDIAKLVVAEIAYKPQNEWGPRMSAVQGDIRKLVVEKVATAQAERMMADLEPPDPLTRDEDEGN